MAAQAITQAMKRALQQRNRSFLQADPVPIRIGSSQAW